MFRRTIVVLTAVSSLLFAKLVKQPAVNGYQRLTMDISMQELGMIVYGDLGGGVSVKYSNSNEWITITLDPMWEKLTYMHSYLDGNERTADAIDEYEGKNEGVISKPHGICYDSRNDGYSTRHYFFISMPGLNTIKRYYYDETDEEIHYSSQVTVGSGIPNAVAFCEGTSNYDWLVYSDPQQNRVGLCLLFDGGSRLVSTHPLSNIGGLRGPRSIAISRYGTLQRRVYVADKYNHRIVSFLVQKQESGSYPEIVPGSEKVLNLGNDVSPTAIATANYPSDFGLYVLDGESGDVYVLSADLDWIVAKYETSPSIYKCRHLGLMDGEAGASERWKETSGMQYFWLDCEVNNLRVSPSRIPQGVYPNIEFDLTGPASKVTATIKNSSGNTVASQVYGGKGIDKYDWQLYDAHELQHGTYTVIVKAIDPYGESDESDENYTEIVHSADTAELIIEPAYAWIGFESNEPQPFSNSFLFNNCCTNVTALRTQKEDNDKLRPHSGNYMFRVLGYDDSSDENYDCVDVKLFENCGIPISKPCYLSCWIKATAAPGGAESLHVSIDGIVEPWTQLKNWTEYGRPIDQYGQRIHSAYHPVPVDSQWHRYVFALTPAAGDTIRIIQFSYWGVPSEATGQFIAYIDDISFDSEVHLSNWWYPETFGNGSGSSHTNGDPNFELGLSHKDEDGGSCYGGARIIVDGHGDSGEGSHWLSPVPSLRKDFHPYKQLEYSLWYRPTGYDTTCKVSWMQYDKAHATLLGFLIDDRWLYYVWNSPQRWPDDGYVQMLDNPAEHEYVYNEWQIFTRDIYRDYMDEYPTASAPQELQAYRIMHYCRSDWDGDNGGIVKGPVFMDGGPDTPGPNNVPTVIRPNGGEKWIEGTTQWYIHGLGNDLPKLIAVYWADDFGLISINELEPHWKLIDIREFQPLPPPMSYFVPIGLWIVPNGDEDKPNCGFKTVGLNMHGFPLPGQSDVSDGTFTILDLLVSQPDDGRQFCSTPQIPGTSPSIGWQANGVCGVEEIDLYYTTQGGYDQQVMASNFMSGGGDIWTSIASGLSPGTYQPIDSIYDSYEDTTYYEHAYVGAYDDWVVPNIPTSGGNLKFVAHDSTGDSALYIMPQTFNIPFGGATAYSTAQTADKIVTDASQTHLVYADESGNILTSSNSDTYEWEELDTIGQGQLPSLALNDDGDPCAVWVTGTENQQNLAFSRYVQGAWSAPVVLAPADPTGATRYSESNLREWKADTISMAYFKSIGSFVGPNFEEIGLFDTRFDQSNPLSQSLDTIWGETSNPLTPISSAPAFIIDSYDGSHYAFNWGDSTIYIYIDATIHFEIICQSPVLWPCLSATDGNIYLTYGVEVGGETCLIQRWKHPQDTIWRGEDTLYKGSLAYTQTLGGAATLLYSSSGELSRLSFDPVEDTTSIVPVGEDTYFPHGALSYLGLEDGLPLIWTQQSGSSFYIATDWHDPDETIFPSYYINAGEELTPYTQYRDSTVDYGEALVDWGSDSVTYELDNLDPLCSHTLLLEFYFEDQDHYTRKYFITTAGQTDTIDFTTYDLERMTMGIPGGVSDITVKITSDSGSVKVSRLLLYQGEEAGGMMMMSTKEAKKQPIPYVLYQNFPNPFVGTTRIRYALPYDRHVSLKVYDVTGRRVRTLVDDHKTPGIYDLSWDGKDNTRLSLPAGVYFIRFATEDFEQTKKAVLLK